MHNLEDLDHIISPHLFNSVQRDPAQVWLLLYIEFLRPRNVHEESISTGMRSFQLSLWNAAQWLVRARQSSIGGEGCVGRSRRSESDGRTATRRECFEAIFAKLRVWGRVKSLKEGERGLEFGGDGVGVGWLDASCLQHFDVRSSSVSGSSSVV